MGLSVGVLVLVSTANWQGTQLSAQEPASVGRPAVGVWRRSLPVCVGPELGGARAVRCPRSTMGSAECARGGKKGREAFTCRSLKLAI